MSGNMENSTTVYDKRMSHLVGIGLVLGFLLPHTSTAFLLVNPLLCLFYQCFKQNRVYYKNNWIVVIPVLLSLFINYPQGVEMKALYSCMAILLYFFCFPMVVNVKVPNIYFYFTLIFIFISQIAYAYNISFMEYLLNTYYPLSEGDVEGIYEQNAVNSDNILHFRLGGLFHNSNQCANYLTFLLAGFIVFNSEKTIRKMLPFILISFYAVLLTGSRTGFVVASLIIIAYLFVDKRISLMWRLLVVAIAVSTFMVLIWSGSNTFRGFNIEDGFSGSAMAKMNTFAYYLSSEKSVFRFLLGYMDSSRFDISNATSYVMGKFDSDYGSIIFSYGFIGFFAILYFLFTIFKKMDRYGRLFFIVVLWMYSSTIIQSYRALFLFMLLLSCVYGQHKKNKNIKNI